MKRLLALAILPIVGLAACGGGGKPSSSDVVHQAMSKLTHTQVVEACTSLAAMPQLSRMALAEGIAKASDRLDLAPGALYQSLDDYCKSL